MPASSQDTILPITESLKSSLAKQSGSASLSQRLKSSSKQILMQKIHFLPATKASHLYQLASLRAKYTPLNASFRKYSSSDMVEGYKSPQNIKMSGDDLPVPKVVLYPPENIKLDWPKIQHVGAGLVNLGNTCFLNSTLQCLIYTAPLVNYLMAEDHCNTCKLVSFCMLCELHKLIKRCFNQQGRIEPTAIVHKLRVIAKHMHIGSQEDAQEFLRYVIDKMQEACLTGHKQLDYISKQTTVVNQIFGGYLRSQVVCLKCNARSNTYEMFMDISLNIENVPTVTKALERYTHPERLDSDNAYNCAACKQKVPATKRFTIHKPPNILTLQLKRFDCFRPSAKVTRHVKFSEQLDLRPFMSNKTESPVLYQLYAVLVHSGYTCNSGHYYCFVQAPNSMWYCMNDQHVSRANINRVLSAEAYLLFYKRNKSKVASMQSNVTYPTVQRTLAPCAGLCNDVGSPVERKPVQIGPVPSDSNNIAIGDQRQTKFHNGASAVSVSAPPKMQFKPFSIAASSKLKASVSSSASSSSSSSSSLSSASVTTSTPNGVHVNTSSVIPGSQSGTSVNPSSTAVGSEIKTQLNLCSSASTTNSMKPRLVMRIKHGSVCYNSVEDGKNSKSGSSNMQSKPKLVPYNGESDDDEVPARRNGLDIDNCDKSIISQPNDLVGKPQDKRGVTVNQNSQPSGSVAAASHLLERESCPSSNRKPEKGRLPPHPSTDLNLTVDINQAKVNATSKWNVLSADSQVSPSQASGSSNCSINSTTEWHVHESNKNKHTLPVQQPAWPTPAAMAKKQTDEQQQKCDRELEKSSNTNSQNTKFELDVHIDKNHLQTTSPSFSAEKDLPASKSHKKHKKDKKHKKQKHDGSGHADLSPSLKKKKHKKKHKKRKHEDLDSDDKPVKKRRSEDGEYMWIEKTRDLSDSCAFYKDHCGTHKHHWSSNHDKAASHFSGKNTKQRHTDNGYDRHHNAKYTDRKKYSHYELSRLDSRHGYYSNHKSDHRDGSHNRSHYEKWDYRRCDRC